MNQALLSPRTEHIFDFIFDGGGAVGECKRSVAHSFVLQVTWELVGEGDEARSVDKRHDSDFLRNQQRHPSNHAIVSGAQERSNVRVAVGCAVRIKGTLRASLRLSILVTLSGISK